MGEKLEFGHHAVIGRFDPPENEIGFCLDAWGTGPFRITATDGKVYRFEDSDQFGPYLVTRRGDIAATQLPERSPFWRAHWLWRRQGRQIAEDGTCVWREPKPTTAMLKGRQIIILEHGEPDGILLVDGKRMKSGEMAP